MSTPLHATMPEPDDYDEAPLYCPDCRAVDHESCAPGCFYAFGDGIDHASAADELHDEDVSSSCITDQLDPWEDIS